MRHQRRAFLAALTAAAGSALLPEPFAAAAQAPAVSDPAAKEAVSGIGGFFFRAHDPKAIEQWYREHLGIAVTPQKIDDPVWTQQAGQTVFSAFSETTKYFDPAKQWMMNFRVTNLDRLVAQLQAAGIEVKVDPTTYPNGRFAHTHDPEGNPIELWQPMSAAK